MNPVSEGNFLTDVWGPSPDNLFATGGGGIVMRYDGQKWRLTHTPVTENLNAIWGTDASHVWAATGNYPVVLRAWNNDYPTGIAATGTVHVVAKPVHYVVSSGSSPSTPT